MKVIIRSFLLLLCATISVHAQVEGRSIYKRGSLVSLIGRLPRVYVDDLIQAEIRQTMAQELSKKGFQVVSTYFESNMCITYGEEVRSDGYSVNDNYVGGYRLTEEQQLTATLMVVSGPEFPDFEKQQTIHYQRSALMFTHQGAFWGNSPAIAMTKDFIRTFRKLERQIIRVPR